MIQPGKTTGQPSRLVRPFVVTSVNRCRTFISHTCDFFPDGKRSAQFEHTLIVNETGYELLTARENEPVMKWNPEFTYRP